MSKYDKGGNINCSEERSVSQCLQSQKLYEVSIYLIFPGSKQNNTNFFFLSTGEWVTKQIN